MYYTLSIPLNLAALLSLHKLQFQTLNSTLNSNLKFEFQFQLKDLNLRLN